MNTIEKLLEPVSAESPCGQDLAYDQAFLDLETQVKGKPEDQFAESASEEPNWKDVQENAEELVARGKQLQVAVILTLAWVRTRGIAGLRDGLQLIQGWVEKYWDTLFPLLDAEDNNDPTQRVNILQNLSNRTFGDVYRIVDRLAEAPLAESRSFGKYGLGQIKESANAGEIDAALRDTDPALIQERYQAAQGALESLAGIETLLTDKIGSAALPSFEILRDTLKDIESSLGPHAGAPGSAPASSQGAAESAAAGLTAGGPFKGTIATRADVLTALEAIMSYYRRHEPSSPVPLLMERAQRLAQMDFLQIMNDLTPASLDQIRLITGTREEPPPPAE